MPHLVFHFQSRIRAAGLCDFLKVGDQVPQRRGLVGGGGGDKDNADERVIVRHRRLFGGEGSDGMVGGSGSSWWH